MLRKLFIPVAMLVATPALAHEGLELDSFIHHVLHRVGTENVIAIGAIGALACMLVLWRARAKRRTASRPATFDAII
jgi:hypothetical protein